MHYCNDFVCSSLVAPDRTQGEGDEGEGDVGERLKEKTIEGGPAVVR
jgi:hypothetical protein